MRRKKRGLKIKNQNLVWLAYICSPSTWEERQGGQKPQTSLGPMGRDCLQNRMKDNKTKNKKAEQDETG
jgi:hypothetical protein